MFSASQNIQIFIPDSRRCLSLPLFTTRISAGFPSPAEDFTDGTLDLNDLIEHPAATFIIRVSGYSMTGAGIFDGDLLIVDRSITPVSGKIVVAVTGGDMVVKRLKKKRNRWWLLPESPDHPEFSAMIMDEESKIWGVVKNVIRNLS